MVPKGNMSQENLTTTVSGLTVAEPTEGKEISDSESEEGDVSPFVLAPISFRSLVGHDDEVNACCFSPDWTRLVSGGDDWVIKVWDTHSGQPVYTLKSHKGAIKCCCFARSGDMFASGSYDHNAIIWNANTGEEIHKLQAHTHSVETCSFSNDSSWLCTGSWDCSAIIWSVKTGDAMCTCLGHSSGVQCCTFSTDSLYMASGSWDCSVRLWSFDLSLDFKRGQNKGPSCHALQGHKSNVKAVSFSCKGLLASASWDLCIILWDINTKSINFILRGHTGWIQACTFSPDGSALVSAADDQTVRVWDVVEGNCIKELECSTEEIHTCCFKSNGSLLASGPVESLYEPAEIRIY